MTIRNTPNYGLTYPESGDHTRTWEYWQAIAVAVDTLLAGKSLPLKFANDVTIGDPAAATDNMLKIAKLIAPDAWEARHRIFSTANGPVATIELFKAAVEQAQLVYRSDGQLFTKSGGAAGTSRPVPFAMAGGFVNVPVGGVAVGSADWVYPAGRFSVVPPLVFATSTNSSWFVTITSPAPPNDVLKCIVTARSYNGTNGSAGLNIGVHLMGLQMFATANGG